MEESAEWVREAIPGAYVRTLEVGNGIVDSISKPMQWQLEQLAAGLRADPKLRRGLHLIGHSQGSLLARAYVQRYNSPRVHTLVSWTGPQAGFFGVPDLEPLLKRANHWTSPMWYTPNLQKSFSFASYWRDPRRLAQYRRDSPFLADINNERETKNATYVQRLTSLTHFVLIKSHRDTIIRPGASAWFGFYAENSTRRIEPLERTPLYQEDWLGLRQLDREGKLHYAECDCKHVQVPSRLCKLAVWEHGTRRYLQPAGVRGWLKQLLDWPRTEVEDDDDEGARRGGGSSADGASTLPKGRRRPARVRDMNDVFSEAAAAFGEQAKQEMARAFEKLSRDFPHETLSPG